MTKHALKFLMLALLGGFTGLSMAGDAVFPTLPEANARFSDAQGCVEPTDDMRKNHMEYILHQRDKTMHEGIRTKQHSLVECINCHVSTEPDAPRHTSEDHFCSACHSYASVKIDCFQCHADRPVSGGYKHSLSESMMGGHHTTSGGNPIELGSDTLQVLLTGERAK